MALNSLGVRGRWNGRRRNSKPSLDLLDLGPPLRVPAAEDEVDSSDLFLSEGSTPAATFPVSKSPFGVPRSADYLHARKRPLQPSQVPNVNGGVESRTSTGISHVENGTQPQGQGCKTDGVLKTSSFPNIHSQFPILPHRRPTSRTASSRPPPHPSSLESLSSHPPLSHPPEKPSSHPPLSHPPEKPSSYPPLSHPPEKPSSHPPLSHPPEMPSFHPPLSHPPEMPSSHPPSYPHTSHPSSSPPTSHPPSSHLLTPDPPPSPPHPVSHPQFPPPPSHPPQPSPPPSHSHPPSSHPAPLSHPHQPSPHPPHLAPPKSSPPLPTSDEDVVLLKFPTEEEKPFRKLGLLGRGGSSKVFKVISEDHEIFALKEVYLKFVDNAVRRTYIKEINILKELKNLPEVITLHHFEWNKKEFIVYLLLEYAETDLAAIMKKSKPSIPMALYFWSEMLRIMEAIHREGIMHNDLKPENFVCIHGRLKLIDFGIANQIDDERTSVERNLQCGTINYMAPEAIETYEDKDFFKVGKPSDVWSLGCILYQMLYGHTPFHEYKKLQKLQAIIDPLVSISFPDLRNSAAVDVMKKCLNRNPKVRPTVADLLSHPFTLYHTPPQTLSPHHTNPT